MRILIAVDGSPVAVRAARYAARLSLAVKHVSHVTPLNVDAPLLKSVAVELGVLRVARYHAENGAFDMRGAKSTLSLLKAVYDARLLIGDVVEAIVKHAKTGKIDLVVMDSHGRSAFKSVLLGSIATKVLAHSQTPVTIVR